MSSVIKRNVNIVVVCGIYTRCANRYAFYFTNNLRTAGQLNFFYVIKSVKVVKFKKTINSQIERRENA